MQFSSDNKSQCGSYRGIKLCVRVRACVRACQNPKKWYILWCLNGSRSTCKLLNLPKVKSSRRQVMFTQLPLSDLLPTACYCFPQHMFDMWKFVSVVRVCKLFHRWVDFVSAASWPWTAVSRCCCVVCGLQSGNIVSSQASVWWRVCVWHQQSWWDAVCRCWYDAMRRYRWDAIFWCWCWFSVVWCKHALADATASPVHWHWDGCQHGRMAAAGRGTRLGHRHECTTSTLTTRYTPCRLCQSVVHFM